MTGQPNFEVGIVELQPRRQRRRWGLAVLGPALLLAAACDSDDPGGALDSTTTLAAAETTVPPATTLASETTAATTTTVPAAETMAIHKALNDGITEFDTVVGVRYTPETDEYAVVNGCGWCRQLFSYNAPLKVIIDNDGTLEVVEAEELLPHAFL